MGTYKPVPKIIHSGKLHETETIVNLKLWRLVNNPLVWCKLRRPIGLSAIVLIKTIDTNWQITLVLMAYIIKRFVEFWRQKNPSEHRWNTHFVFLN